MYQTQDFIRGLRLAVKNAELPEFREEYPNGGQYSFEDTLKQYKQYYDSMEPEKQTLLQNLFWNEIKAVGTPIIEDVPDGNSKVYFLFQRSKLKDSTENVGEKRELYLQGDFHGYGSTFKNAQSLEQLPGTDIMFHSDTMPKGALVTYYYVQLEPSYGDKSAIHFYGDLAFQPPSFFPVTPEVPPENMPGSKTKEEIAMVSNLFWGEDNVLVDENCKFHKSYDQNSGFFCADINKSVADLGFPVRTKGDNQFFDNFFASKLKNASLVLASENDKIIDYPENKADLDKCSRSILVFSPEDKQAIENVVIMYDGRFYQLGNTQERLERLFDQNTVVIYINPEKGIEEEAIKSGIQFDAADSLPGMKERTVDLRHRVDEYAKFIHEELLPALVNRGFKIPDDPNKRVLVGASLAGTASIYMGMKYPQWFGKVVAQSPSIANREKLEDFVKQGRQPPPPEIYLSCGQFECPEHARNLGLPFSKELAAHLNIKLNVNAYGHQMEGWSQDLEISLSALGLIATQQTTFEAASSSKPVFADVEDPIQRTFVTQYHSHKDKSVTEDHGQKAHDAKDDIQRETSGRTKKFD